MENTFNFTLEYDGEKEFKNSKNQRYTMDTWKRKLDMKGSKKFEADDILSNTGQMHISGCPKKHREYNAILTKTYDALTENLGLQRFKAVYIRMKNEDIIGTIEILLDKKDEVSNGEFPKKEKTDIKKAYKNWKETNEEEVRQQIYKTCYLYPDIQFLIANYFYFKLQPSLHEYKLREDISTDMFNKY